MSIKAVLFDLGWTLVKMADFPEIYRRILRTLGIRVSSEDVLEAHRTDDEEIDVDARLIAGMVEMGQTFWIKWNLKVLEKIGIRENRDFLAKKIDELWWEHADLEVYPDVVSTVTKLKAKGLKVGVITNGLKRDFECILGKLKLTRLFDVVVGIDSCNKAKPDRQIFLYALNKLHVLPEETIFVGDSVKYDYEGAIKAGMKPLLIDREGKAKQGIETIGCLAEILLHV